MAKRILEFGGNVSPQYINPIQSNINIGKLQTTAPNNGMKGNLTKGGKLDIKTPETPASGGFLKNMDAGSAIGGVAGLAGLAAPLVGDNAVGDALGGVGSGVAAGAALGPIGMGVGAVVGGLTSIIGGNKRRREARKAKVEQSYKSMAADAQQRSSQMTDDTPDVAVMKSGGWIQKAINPSHKGYCTPITKPTCTGHRKALALRFKKGGDLHKAYGGDIKDTTNIGNTKLLEYGGQTHEESSIGGTPVDANGQLTSMNNADALVEKNEVAWNKGKNNTYVFSDRLGFAKDAKSIMKRYEKRLGKNLDGQDNISKNTMNMQLSNLENRQEAVKSQLQQPITNQMANGGDITTNTNNAVIPKSAFKYPETIEKFGSFKKDLEANPTAKDRARLYHYKQVLDPLLQAKDVKGYAQFTANVPKAIKERVKLADTAYGEGKYKSYVSPEEIQKTLGEDYNDYISLIDKFQKPALGIAGTKEKDKPITDLNYGLRNSLSISPYGIVNVNKDQTTNELKSQFNADVMYNPKTKSYDYNYKEPKEFMCGGKIKKMDKGGNIPYKEVEPFNMKTPSENIDYLGRSIMSPISRNNENITAPKGIGSYIGTNNTKKSKAVKSEVSSDKSYLGDILPIVGGTALSMAGTAYAFNKLKKPKPINLGRVNAQTINLESARESAKQGAGEAMGNIRTAAKGIGSPNYMNEVIAGTVGTQRELGKNLTQSYLAEQTANAAARESADKTNLAATAQEAGMNLQQLDKYKDTKAGLTSNLFTLPAMGVADYLGQKSIMDAAQLGSKYKFKTDPKNRFKRIMVVKGDKE